MLFKYHKSVWFFLKAFSIKINNLKIHEVKQFVVPPEKDPGAEGVPMGDEKADEDIAALKTEDQDEYDVEEPVLDADKQLNNKPDNVGIGTSASPTASTVSAKFPAERDFLSHANDCYYFAPPNRSGAGAGRL